MATGDLILSQIIGRTTTGSVHIISTHHYSADPGTGIPQLESYALDFGDTMWTPIRACITTAFHVEIIKHVVVFGPNAGLQYLDAAYTGQTGDLGVLSEDYAYAVVMQRSDGTAQRAGHGRFFMAPIANTVFDEAGLMVAAPAGLAALEANMLLPLADSSANVYRPVVANAAGDRTQIFVTGHSQRAGIRKHRRFR